MDPKTHETFLRNVAPQQLPPNFEIKPVPREISCTDNRQTRYIDSTYARAKIRGIVELLGKDTLGFTKEEVGLHSIRSGGAIAIFLSGATLIIQRAGRWESDAFMEYIREQVESFSTAGVSSKMITNEHFYHLTHSQNRIAIESNCDSTNTEENGVPLSTPNFTLLDGEALDNLGISTSAVPQRK